MSARANPRAVAVVGQTIGGLTAGVAALFVGISMSPAAWWWSAMAALGDSVGVVFLYRGLSRGRMAVVAPLSGIGAAALPVMAGFLDGERPGPWAGAGLLAAIPAILLVAHVRDTDDRPSAWSDGLIAGIGFGMSFLAIARLPHGAGLAGLSLTQLGAALAVALTMVAAPKGAWTIARAQVWGVAATGVLATVAFYLFQLASHRGYLSEAAVLSALYPAATVALALIVLRERVTRVQVVGFAVCVVSIGLIVSG